jgi:hypothetical protein
MRALFFLAIFPLLGLLWQQVAQGQSPTQVAPVEEGAKYVVRACFGGSLTSVQFLVQFFSLEGGMGQKLAEQRPRGKDVGGGCWESQPPALAPCGAHSARYGVIEPTDQQPTSLELVKVQDAGETCLQSPTPTPIPTPGPQPSPTPTPAPAPAPPAPPPPGPIPPELPRDDLILPPIAVTPTSSPVMEPVVFATLTNGSFELGRDDGTPFGWQKYGGRMERAKGRAAHGQYSLALYSDTSSTKWAYQVVSVEGGKTYQLSGYVLKNDPQTEALWLRLSWYASHDGSGTAIASNDSQLAVEDGPEFRFLTTGPVTAPFDARTAKVRLMMRPRSAAPARGYFDAIVLEETIPAEPITTPPDTTDDHPISPSPGAPTRGDETSPTAPQARPSSSSGASARPTTDASRRPTGATSAGRSPALGPGSAAPQPTPGSPISSPGPAASPIPTLVNVTRPMAAGEREPKGRPSSLALPLVGISGGLGALALAWAGGMWWRYRSTRTPKPGPDGKC